jgi:3-dehydroquinate synthetase
MIKNSTNLISISKTHRVSYQVLFTEGLFTKGNQSLKNFCSNKMLVVIDKKVHKIYRKRIVDFFKSIDCEFEFFLFEATEENKNMNSVMEICEAAKGFRMKRDSVFIGIGGGITLDVLGFAASMFRRKANYIRIPTTLLGIVDAGVGVKVGVNHKNSKNLLGAYYAPLASFNDQSFLETLPSSEVRNGLYEIIKMALCDNRTLFVLLENNFQLFLKRKFNSITDKINRSAALAMMKCLEPNLYENNLKRKVDFGHTFSQYIEEATCFRIKHGEAVGMDMFISSYIAHQRGLMSDEDFQRVIKLFKSIGGLAHFNRVDAKDLYNSLDAIRDHRAGKLNLVLPTELGRCIFTQKCSLDEITGSVELGLKIFN